MELTGDERRLLLAGLYVLSITNSADNDEELEAVKVLACRLGGDLGATFFSRA